MPVIFDRVSFQPSGLANNSRRHRHSGQGGGIIQTAGFLSAAWGAGAGASAAQTEIAASSPTTGIRARICDLLFARPHVLSAARLKENCFSLSFIAAPSCQAWRRASTGDRCRFSDSVRPPQGCGWGFRSREAASALAHAEMGDGDAERGGFPDEINLRRALCTPNSAFRTWQALQG